MNVAPLLVCFGGGVNSTAMLFGLKERGITPCAIFFADTGGEKPGTYAHLWRMSAWCLSAEFPSIQIVVNDGMHGTLEAECLTNTQLPSKAYGFSSCSEKYKARPQNKAARKIPSFIAAWARGERVIKAIGFDYGEERRVKVTEDAHYALWYPLIEWRWQREDCLAAIQRAGLPLPPKSACFFCPSSTKAEVRTLSREHPELAARAVAMERNAREHELRMKGLGRNWSWEDVIAADADQFSLFPPDPPEVSCLCYDGE